MGDAQESRAACLGPGGAAERVEAALGGVRGRWKLTILPHLFAKPVMRFSELDRALGEAPQTAVTRECPELGRDGLVARTVHPQVPPPVEYRLTDRGAALRPILRQATEWDAGRLPTAAGQP